MTKVSDPIRINRTVVKNRITFAPTVKFDYAGPDGKVTQKHIEHYKERAEHNCGLICVEATAVTPDGRFGPNHLGLWEDQQIDGHRVIVENGHKNNTVMLIQLNHTGIVSNPECGPSIGPSEVETRQGARSRAMTVEEIHRMQDHYAAAALRAREAGYDGIQLHGCHGYLINQFLNETTNLRTDEYGGSAENRARFAAEIIRGIRKSCGEDFIISVRTVGADPDLKSAIAVAEEYVKAGCDYLQVSHGYGASDPTLAIGGVPFGLICSLGVHFHEHFAGRVPVSCVNGIFEPSTVRYLIENDLTDTVDLARAILADPAFPEAVLSDSPYVRCFECQRCQYGPFTQHKCPAELKRRKA
ncbi:MAG: NADH:flavin oxidoreductase [Lachnospiraceae bacterium]|nr:NADH:flavin oxidoreductase [Lachnospiraceae bacterium]